MANSKFSLDWTAVTATQATEALQSSKLFRAEAAPDLNQTAYYGPAGVIIFIAVISKLAYALDISSYRRLDDTARLTFINRALFCLVYLVSFVPYSISTYFIFFSPTTATAPGGQKVKNQLQEWALRLLSLLLGVQLSMHVYEAGCRSVVDVDYFLILHHIVQCAFPILAFQSQSPFVLKLTVVISCFASYEFLLHAALICSKMPVLRKWFRWLTIIGLMLYIATRLVQTFLIILLFVAGFNPMNTSQSHDRPGDLEKVPGHSAGTIAVYWIALFMCIVITAQQMWKLVIYRNLWRSTTAAAKPVRTSSGTIKVPRASNSRTARASRASRGQAHHNTDSPQQGLKSTIRSLTRAASSELSGNDADKPVVQLSRNVDTCSSQNVLLDDIVEDLPVTQRAVAANQSADNAV